MTLRRVRASMIFLARRLRARWALSLAVVLGLGAMVGIWVAIPLYAESASSRLLSVEVDDAANDGVPFGYLISYNRLSGGNQSWADFAPLTELVDGADNPFGSTVRASQRLTTTIPFDLITTAGDSTGEPTVIDSLPFVSLSAFDDLVDIVEGRTAVPAAEANSIEVMIDEAFAMSNAIEVDERLSIVNRRADLDDANRTFDVRIAGIWRRPALDGTEPVDPRLRFLANGSLSSALVVPEQTVSDVLDAINDAALSNAQWLILLDSDTVTTDSVDQLLANTERISRQVDDRLRGARVLVTPETSLEGFQAEVAALNRGLALFSLPTLALVLALVGLIVALRWQRRTKEVSLLRRRGVPASQIVAETAGEAVVLGFAGSVVGFLAARSIATFMGRTTTFLQLGSDVELTLVMNSRSWRALAIATLVGVAVVVAPSIGATSERLLTGDTSLDEPHTSRQPWWQRSRLDLILVGATAFFSWFLLKRDVLQGDLLDDPIVILLPALTALATGLVALRLLPWFTSKLAGLLERTNSTAGLLVTRRIARAPRALTAPILLLVITGALAIYTGSLARTLDLQLLDAAHHRVGAENSVRSAIDGQLGSRFEIADGRTVPLAAGGPTIDPNAFSKIWGVRSASRFATLPGRVSPQSGSAEPVTFTGVDTTTFADLAFWRNDYADESLGELIGRLRATPDSVLVSTGVLARTGVQLGDFITLSVRDVDRTIHVEMVVVGSFDQFPTWVPGDPLPPVVGSLSDFEARSGTSLAREILFETDDRLPDPAQTAADFSRLGIAVANPQRPDSLIEQVQLRPARQGVFGLLTVSFVLSAALTVVGFVFYALFGFTQQMTELGVLRALGLPVRSLMKLVALDLLIVSLVGVGCGTLAGLAMSKWYLPALVEGSVGRAPRLLAEIDWNAAIGIPLLLAAVLTTAAMILMLGLRRIRLFEAVKVGAGQ